MRTVFTYILLSCIAFACAPQGDVLMAESTSAIDVFDTSARLTSQIPASVTDYTQMPIISGSSTVDTTSPALVYD